MQLPVSCQVVVDTPRFAFLKLRDDQSVDFVSPLPCPFNYGSVPGTRSGDGDRIDALVLGPRLSTGATVEVPVLAVVDFIDAGQHDPKWVCGVVPMSRATQLSLIVFFRTYAACKVLLNLARGRKGDTAFRGLRLRAP